MEQGQRLADKNDVLEHGPIRLHLVSGHAQVDDLSVELQPKQFHLLAYLIRNADRAIPTDELWRNVFRCQNALGGSHVRRQIMELRRRLGSAGVLIQTARAGYRLSSSDPSTSLSAE